jgi:hypothetical protein
VAVGLSAVAGTAFAACGGGDDNAAVQSSGGTGLSGGSGRTAGGPAPAPLTAVQITTTGGTITVA